jgi:hypothetical protein
LLLQLDVVEKGLNDFLETKKMAFPRWVLARLPPPLLQLCRIALKVTFGDVFTKKHNTTIR